MLEGHLSGSEKLVIFNYPIITISLGFAELNPELEFLVHHFVLPGGFRLGSTS